MPRRILPADFGTGLLERQLTDMALNAYPFITRALCYYGGAEYIPSVIQIKAYEGRTTPCVEDVTKMLNEYKQAALLERWIANGGIEYIWFTRWFDDNSFIKDTVPSIPRPPSLARLIKRSEWESGERHYFAKLNKKFSKKIQKGSLEEEGEVEAKEEDIQCIFDYYRENIQPRCKLLPEALRRIGKALSWLSVDQLKTAIDNREHDKFFWDENSHRGPSWFFEKRPRLEAWLAKKPKQKTSGDQSMEIDE